MYTVKVHVHVHEDAKLYMYMHRKNFKKWGVKITNLSTHALFLITDFQVSIEILLYLLNDCLGLLEECNKHNK